MSDPKRRARHDDRVTLDWWNTWVAHWWIFVDEPTREPIIEKIAPGDVLDTGAIMTSHGELLDYGTIYLNAKQQLAAAYYGWVADHSRRALDETTGCMCNPTSRWKSR